MKGLPHDSRRVASRLCGLAAAGLLAACGSAADPELLPTRLDELPKLEGRKVVVMKPDVQLNVVHSGGLPELNAEWTTLGQDYVVDALRWWLTGVGVEMIAAEQIDAAQPEDTMVAQITLLHSAVANGIVANHFEPLDRLPTKGEGFDWSLGQEAQILKRRYQADYALFVVIRENYPSDTFDKPDNGLLADFSALLSLLRTGYASLVDLESGRIVWFAKRDAESPGLRTRYKARTTISDMLVGFPE